MIATNLEYILGLLMYQQYSVCQNCSYYQIHFCYGLLQNLEAVLFPSLRKQFIYPFLSH